MECVLLNHWVMKTRCVVMKYVKYLDIVDKLEGIHKGDIVLVSSNIIRLVNTCAEHGEKFDPNLFIETFMRKLGTEGTLMFPVYCWDFSEGRGFDYYKTSCFTGALAKAALKRSDFKRTKHPMYSLAVWGKDTEYLCSLHNISAFAADSPFAYLYHNHAKQIIIDVGLEDSFTFPHYVEQQLGGVPYRFVKNFTSNYVDENGVANIRTYSTLVRHLDMNVTRPAHILLCMEEKLADAGALKRQVINDSLFRVIHLYDSYDVVKNDVVYNRSRSLCVYDGQED